jgi:hypothetical protein
MIRTVATPPIPEAEIQCNGMQWLRLQGCKVHRRNTGAMRNGRGRLVRFSERGAADTWFIDPRGVHGEVEWKRFGERPTYDQTFWLIDHNGIGQAYAFWVDNLATLETVYRWVQSGGRIEYGHGLRRYRVEGRHVWYRDGSYDLYRGDS